MSQIKIVEAIKTHIFSITFFSENRAVYEVMWKNIAQPDRLHIDNMAHAHCILDT
jgi:hypothetical protein